MIICTLCEWNFLTFAYCQFLPSNSRPSSLIKKVGRKFLAELQLHLTRLSCYLGNYVRMCALQFVPFLKAMQNCKQLFFSLCFTGQPDSTRHWTWKFRAASKLRKTRKPIFYIFCIKFTPKALAGYPRFGQVKSALIKMLSKMGLTQPQLFLQMPF